MSPALDLSRVGAAVARITEADCIGCTKCIQACPVDAILGAAKLMHTVIAAECTGCELCIPPCPTDCIVMQPMASSAAERAGRRSVAQLRHQRRIQRLANLRDRAARTGLCADKPRDPREAVIAAAIARAKAKKAGRVLTAHGSDHGSDHSSDHSSDSVRAKNKAP